MFKFIPFLLLALFLSISCKNDDLVNLSNPSENTTVVNENVTVYNEEQITPGFTLISPTTSTNAYLINMEGFVVNKWESTRTSVANYLTENGDLIRTYIVDNDTFSFGGRTGGIEMYNYNGEIIWDWTYSSSSYTLHHDIALLPNGNILASVWDLKTAQEAIEAGRDPNLLVDNVVWIERIIEIQPLGLNDAQIIWEWSMWDHLVQDIDTTKNNFGIVSENPSRVDINKTIGDANFTHVNSLFYIEEFDQILISSRRLGELFIIDHSTSITEASSISGGNYNKGGDFLYRWGNPLNYNSGTEDNKKLFAQHDIRWINNLPKNGDGNILVFNNARNPNNQDGSTIDEIKLPVLQDGSYNLEPSTNNLPEDYSWSYINEEIYAPRVSGSQRLINGNTLITEGTEGTLWEINNNGEVIWQYVIPLEVNNIFRASRYPSDFPGFQDKDLSIKDHIIID